MSLKWTIPLADLVYWLDKLVPTVHCVQGEGFGVTDGKGGGGERVGTVINVKRFKHKNSCTQLN